MNEKMNSSRGCFERHYDEPATNEYASPLCYMHELDPAYFGLASPTALDRKQRDPGVALSALVITHAWRDKIVRTCGRLRMSMEAFRQTIRRQPAL